MDDDLSDLRNRQSRTEGRVAVLEARADQEAGERAKMGTKIEDISIRVNAHTQSLSALREVQAKHGQLLKHIVTKVDNTEVWLGHLAGRMDLLDSGLTGRMDSLQNTVTGLGGRMDGVETRLDGMENRLDRVETRLDGVDTRLDRVETRLDRVETRLDSVDTRLDGMDTRLGGVETGLAGVKAGVDEILARLGKS